MSLTASRGRLIADVLNARLADLTVSNGYSTNAGNNVLPTGQKDIDPSSDNLPCVVLLPNPSVATAEDSNDEGLSGIILSREFNIEVVDTSPDQEDWFEQSEDIIRDIMQAVKAPSAVPAKNWRSKTLGVNRVTLVATNVEPPAEGVDYLQVSATFAVRYVERFYI